MKIFLHHFNFFISFRQCFLELFRQMTKKRNERGYKEIIAGMNLSSNV